ncbi:hypothetical protein RWE15_09685 [Virgibacillus halophilus]|uniref:Transposase n=1 Tax=Tigheibacillus halophilus TaxID=361280 RepID=A0ABU5C5R2_9BACI|nr:hypothetical protein [Virgibacillus halophilus]
MGTVMALDISMGKSYKVVYDGQNYLTEGEIIAIYGIHHGVMNFVSRLKAIVRLQHFCLKILKCQEMKRYFSDSFLMRNAIEIGLKKTPSYADGPSG